MIIYSIQNYPAFLDFEVSEAGIIDGFVETIPPGSR
jgi:hypothetical protein